MGFGNQKDSPPHPTAEDGLPLLFGRPADLSRKRTWNDVRCSTGDSPSFQPDLAPMKLDMDVRLPRMYETVSWTRGVQVTLSNTFCIVREYVGSK